jgi:hypothetical protein
VADERGDFSAADGEADGRVDEVGEEGDAVLEEVEGDLHHTGRVLDDGDLGAQVHLSGSAQETVNGL